jgi:hypothetical protein
MPEGSARFLREFVSEGETLLAQAEEHLAVLSEGSEDPAHRPSMRCFAPFTP